MDCLVNKKRLDLKVICTVFAVVILAAVILGFICSNSFATTNYSRYIGKWYADGTNKQTCLDIKYINGDTIYFTLLHISAAERIADLGFDDGYHKATISGDQANFYYNNDGWFNAGRGVIQFVGANKIRVVVQTDETPTDNWSLDMDYNFTPVNPSVAVVYNGNELVCDSPAIISDGRTLVPIRAITEAMGANVEWDQKTNTATISLGDDVVKIKTNSKNMTVNGKNVQLDVSAKIVKNRTLVPVRVISEFFKANVDWNQQTFTVNITK